MNPTTASADIANTVAQVAGTLSNLALIVPVAGLVIVVLAALFLNRK